MTKQIVDLHDREKIKFELDKNFLVEAGAGSGKTTSLVERMVQLIHSGKYLIEEIVAITFTKKAANELKNRFQTQLEKAWKKENNLEGKVRLEQALQNIEQCFLGTVHSFCARLLRERPIEAGLDLSFSELEDADDLILVDTVWEAYLSMLQIENQVALGRVIGLGVSFDALKKSFREMKNYPDVVWVTNQNEKPALQETYNRFIGILKEAYRSVPKREPEKGYDALQKAIIQSIRKERYQTNLKDFQMIETFEMFDKKSLKPTLNRWESKEDAKEYDARIKAFFDDHVKPLLDAWKEYCHPIIVEFLKPAFEQYRLLKQKRSLLNFQDLLMKTANLLKYNAEVRAYFQKKYRCLLVDEFQDTDPIQAEIMFYLTSEDVSEENWQKCKPKEGSLFVVGDPKQAIYRFRRADIDIYNRVKTLICAHGGEVLQLTMNFRTVDTVTRGLNCVFKEFLPEEENRYQASYRPLNSYKEDDGSNFTGIKKLLIPGEKKEEIIEHDAEMIAKTIKSMLMQNHRPNEFMILTRYNDGIDIYTKKLQDYGIPLSVSGEMVIGETKEFQELLFLLNIFTDPTNSLYLVSTLRSSFFGISDEELFQWRHAGGAFSMYSQIPECLKEQTKVKFSAVFDKLQKYQKWVRMYTPSVAIAKIIEDIGFYVLLLAKNYGKREYIRFMQIMESIRISEEKGQSNYHSIISTITDFINSKTAVANIEEDENAVRIMNVHKAKGLEAPIVFLAHPAKKVDSATFLSQHIKREEQISKGYFMFSKPNGFGTKEVAIPPKWDFYKEEELAYLNEEEIRILYVAATRAEKAVIISCCEGKNTKNPWNLLIDHLENLEEIEMYTTEFIKSKDVEEAIEITYEQFAQQTSTLTNWIDKCKLSSYEKYSPTDDKDEIYTLDIERSQGGGKNWGLLVHEVFERLTRKQDMFHIVPQLLTKYEFSHEREEEVWSLVRSFQASSVWNQIQNAEIVLSETPFTLNIKSDHELYSFVQKSSEQHPYLVTGVIDLVYKYHGKWYIVDYKTDRPKDENDLQKLSEYYYDQVFFYTKAWEQLTKEEVVSADLYFVTFNMFYKII